VRISGSLAQPVDTILDLHAKELNSWRTVRDRATAIDPAAQQGQTLNPRE
jgi:hypothetical protein